MDAGAVPQRPGIDDPARSRRRVAGCSDQAEPAFALKKQTADITHDHAHGDNGAPPRAADISVDGNIEGRI
jgi:hypothetical protein